MTITGWLQIALFGVIVILITRPFGGYMTRVFAGERTFLSPLLRPVERAVYWCCGVGESEEQHWLTYAVAMLLFSIVGFVTLYALQRLQWYLPFNPQEQTGVEPSSAFNTSVSFVTNTNWQSDVPETTMGYLVQMAGLTVHNFVSAATGIALALALIRGFTRREAKTIGNFWVDLTRSTLYVLLPLSIVIGLFYVSQGMPQNIGPYVDATTLEGAKQTIAQGPVASQEAIKILGTNGGGFLNANSAHPYENPTPLTNLIQLITIFSIGAALTNVLGRMVHDERQGWAIRVAKNPDYWKAGRPYLDGIEYTIIKNPSTAIMAFAAGNFDRYAVGILSIPLMKQIQSQAPQAICEVVPWNIPRMLIVNRAAPPFDNPELRRALALTLDRRAFIDILGDGQGSIGGAMMPPPAGAWGMPPELLVTLPTYGPDVAENRAEAREIMKKLGYGPDKRLSVTVTTRNVPAYRDPTVLLIDQLKEIYIDGVMDAVDTTQWYPKVMRKDYTVGVTVGENGLDDPDQQFYENYVCGAERNYTGYCSPEVDKLIDRQSMEADPAKRKQTVWEIERQLAEDSARPIIFYPVSGACRQPQFNGHTMMVNGNYNGWRLEDAWLDK